jgi:hypothetical protein
MPNYAKVAEVKAKLEAGGVKDIVEEDCQGNQFYGTRLRFPKKFSIKAQNALGKDGIFVTAYFKRECAIEIY